MAYICAPAFVIVDGFRASRPVASIASSIEAYTIFLLLLLITFLNKNLIYLRLEGTLSDPVIFQVSEIMIVQRIKNSDLC